MKAAVARTTRAEQECLQALQLAGADRVGRLPPSRELRVAEQGWVGRQPRRGLPDLDRRHDLAQLREMLARCPAVAVGGKPWSGGPGEGRASRRSPSGVSIFGAR
jgi:hypothetical protein